MNGIHRTECIIVKHVHDTDVGGNHGGGGEDLEKEDPLAMVREEGRKGFKFLSSESPEHENKYIVEYYPV